MKKSYLDLIFFTIISILLFVAETWNTTFPNNIPPVKQPDQASQPTTSPQNKENTTAVRVVDGDTIEISGGQKVRYIGIDTPEITGTPDCYGEEASAKNKELVEGKTITMEKDISETDRYGRLLRYVYVDGKMINEILVKEGYAKAATYPPDVKNRELFTQAEQEARENERGLWAGKCD